jgi:hypothetical protein
MSSVPDSDDELDADIEYYASLTDEQIDEELAQLSVDPRPTIDAVNKLVKVKIAEWDRAHGGLRKP